LAYYFSSKFRYKAIYVAQKNIASGVLIIERKLLSIINFSVEAFIGN